MNDNLKKISYQEYLKYNIDKNSDAKKRSALNQSKLRKIKWFIEKFKALGFNYRDKSSLCLGARMGEEVEALIELGSKAIGTDLVPNPPLVIEGDMNYLKFENEFDFVYTNSFDHVYYIDLWAEGVKKSLKYGGILILNVYPSVFNFEKEVVYNETEEDAVEIIKRYLTLDGIRKTNQWFKEYKEKIYIFKKEL